MNTIQRYAVAILAGAVWGELADLLHMAIRYQVIGALCLGFLVMEWTHNKMSTDDIAALDLDELDR